MSDRCPVEGAISLEGRGHPPAAILSQGRAVRFPAGFRPQPLPTPTHSLPHAVSWRLGSQGEPSGERVENSGPGTSIGLLTRPPGGYGSHLSLGSLTLSNGHFHPHFADSEY